VNAEVRWTEQAITDLQAIREFITRDSPRYGRLVAERLFTATERLEAFPLSGSDLEPNGSLCEALFDL
jgi:plasmid stabilization system protein ParE